MLRMDAFGNVLRTPVWSTFSGGMPVLLADTPSSNAVTP
jgi:hypothetical protein